MSYGAVVLAGGHSRRMGQCKARMTIDGITLLERIIKQLSGFDERILSTNDLELGNKLPVQVVPDVHLEAGPLGGLYAALLAAKSDALFCVACDMPNFRAELAAAMTEEFPPWAEAMVCVDGTGRIHPLCAVYAKHALVKIECQLQKGDYRMESLVSRLNCAYFDTKGRFLDEIYLNLNTPEAFQKFLQEKNS